MKLLKFYADWCGPCKQLDIALEELLMKYKYIDLEKINVEKDKEAASRYQVRSIPMLIFVSDDGKPINSFRGYGDKPDSKKKLEDFLALQV